MEVKLHTLLMIKNSTPEMVESLKEQLFFADATSGFAAKIKVFDQSEQLIEIKESLTFPALCEFVIVLTDRLSPAAIRKIVNAAETYRFHLLHLDGKQLKQQNTLEIINKSEFLQTLLPLKNEYLIIGDVHECVHELERLLIKFGFSVSNGIISRTEATAHTTIVSVGDWVDKGSDTARIIDFMYENREFFKFVRGNHESFAHKFMAGEIKGYDAEKVKKYFTSIPTLQNSLSHFNKFEQLFETTLPFVRFFGDAQRPPFIVTHAPCKNKYLGKLDHRSARKQRVFRLDRNLPTEPQLLFLKKEASAAHPLHFFGHVAAQNAFVIENKRHLDAGVASGNKLVGVKVAQPLDYRSVPSYVKTMESHLPLLFNN